MRIYHCGDNSPGKWTIAGLLVITAMMLLPVAGYGVSLPYNLVAANAERDSYDISGTKDIGSIFGNGDTSGKWELNQTSIAQQENGGVFVPIVEPATSVPEPGTLFLLASGLGMMLWRRSRRQH